MKLVTEAGARDVWFYPCPRRWWPIHLGWVFRCVLVLDSFVPEFEADGLAHYTAVFRRIVNEPAYRCVKIGRWQFRLWRTKLKSDQADSR